MANESDKAAAQKVLAQLAKTGMEASPAVPAALAAPAEVAPPPVEIPVTPETPVGIFAPPAPVPAAVNVGALAPQFREAGPSTMPTILTDSGTMPASTQVAAVPETGDPMALKAPVAGALPALDFNAPDVNPALPTQDDINKAFEDLNSQNRRVTAEKLALDKLADEQEKMQQREAELTQKTQAEMDAIDQRVRQKSLPEILSGDSIGSKLGAALALGLGAVSQGLSGAKTNPVVDYFDRVAEQQAQRDKLSLEEKNMLRQQLYERGKIELQKMENATNSAFRKDQIKLQYAELDQKSQALSAELNAKIRAAQANTGKYSGKALSKEQQAALTPEDRKNLVVLPDGRQVLTQTPDDAVKFKDMSIQVNNALDSLEELRKLGTTGSSLSLEDRARAEAITAKLVGALRLPYTGPGAMTEKERDLLIRTLGNPLAIFSLKSVELAKLDQVKRDLRANLYNEAKTRGIREAVVPETYYRVMKNGEPVARTEDELIQEYTPQYPGLRPEQIRQYIQRKVQRL